ncbi:MAG: hypothetical protein GEU90_20560 [Gemmatimonas sp.]|nr:hypothetical protein [Gemmatimonas sp.]
MTRTALAVALLVLVACGGISPSGFSGDVDVLLTRGEAYLATLSLQPAEHLEEAQILALGYAERARIGLGSPFRLVEYALHDPDLPPEVREPLAYGILSRILSGATYYVDPRAVDMVRLSGVSGMRGTGAEQLELIQRVIEAAPTATAGERTIRLGYLLAAAERTIEPGYSSVTAHVAALLSDRRRAREDAVQLLRAAARYDDDPLVLLAQWRRDRRFRVEQPALAAVTVREEQSEATEGPGLALALRTMAQRQSAPVSLVDGATAAKPGHGESLLSLEAAERLRSLADERNYPAQAPIAVAVEINRDGLLAHRGLRRWQREARARFADEAINEERLVAGAALLAGVDADQGQRLPLVMLQSATFLRVWNQEDPWFPGDVGPSARDLEARFGLAGIDFDLDLDPAWQSYYLRMLGRALADLQRVVPTVSVRGLRVRIGDLPDDTRALALHEPRSRVLYLPPRTGAGTLAHEVAHDLDWQLARRRYGARAGYATDMAVRDRRGDRIASAMMGLSASLVQPMTESPLRPHATRPAEIFARGSDWLVAAVLARDGRLGGYLTSFQDPMLTGYGTTRGPDISGGAVPALLSILDGVAPMVDDTREWALETYGPQRPLTPMELARAVTEAGIALDPEERLQVIGQAGQLSFEAVSDCRFGSAEGLRLLVGAQRSLAEASLRAAARGAAIDAIHALADEDAGPAFRWTVAAWIAARLYGAPEPVDPRLEELAPAFDDLLLRASLVEEEGRTPAAATAFRISPVPSLCGGNPFAADSPAGRFRASARSAGF